eukprot:7013872-Pyramimonas_sp.AAC.1
MSLGVGAPKVEQQQVEVVEVDSEDQPETPRDDDDDELEKAKRQSMEESLRIRKEEEETAAAIRESKLEAERKGISTSPDRRSSTARASTWRADAHAHEPAIVPKRPAHEAGD